VSDGVEKAILAGGCFWGMEDLFRKRPGVTSTRVGYTGGDVPNATYRNHGTHAEAIEIVFNPEQTSYRELLEFFFQIHDPTTRNRQGNDIGTSYRSAIFYLDEQQRRLGLPVVALVDTNCDPDDADFVIPGNDDAIRSCSLIVRVIADAIAAGASAVTVEEMAANGRPEEEPEAEQEREAEQPQEEVSSE
jgi:methionine-S-sulfoxide reductase